MADVTGTIGQEEVNLENAATEATLKQLLKAMQGGGGGAGGAGKAKDSLLDLAKQSGHTSKELDELEESADKAGNAMSRGAGHIFNAVKGLAGELLTGGTQISDFTSHIAGAASAIPIFGGPLASIGQLLVSTIDNQIQDFRELSAVGVDVGGGLQEFRKIAASTAMDMDSFKDIVINSSEVFASLNLNGGDGVRQFAKLQATLAKSSNQFTSLGLTMSEVGEFTVDYMKIQARGARFQQMTANQQTNGAKAYILELDRLSKLTGKSRRELADQMDARSQDAAFETYVKTLGDQEKAVRDTVAFYTAKNKQIGDAVAEMVVTNGAPTTAMGKALLNLNPQLGTMVEGLKNGTVTREQFDAAMVKAQEEYNKMPAEQKKAYAISAKAGNEFSGAMTEIGNSVTLKAKTMTEQEKKDAAQKVLDEAAAKERRDKLTAFSTEVQKIKNKITDALIESGVFTTVETALTTLGDAIANIDMEVMKGYVDSFALKLKGLITAFENGNLMETVGTYLKDGLSKLGELMKPHISSALSGLKQMAMDAIFGKKKTQEGPPGGGGNGADLEADNGFTALGDILSIIGGATMAAGLAGLGAMLAAGGVVYLGFKAFTTILKMFANGPVAIGAAVFTAMLIGTGAAITLAGKGIDLAGDGVEKIAAGVEKMANMKGAANFAEISTSLGLLGPALISLTAGGVLDSITSFFGADSPFDKIVDGLNKFKGIDADAITNVKLSGTALESLSKFGDDLDASGLKEYAKQMERLGDALGTINDELTKDNSWLPFYKGDNAGNTKLPNMGGSGSGSSDQLTMLNTTNQSILEVLRLGNLINKQGYRDLKGDYN